MEAVGVILGAVALLDPAYSGLKKLYQGYKLTQSFDEDFQLSFSSFKIQTWIFVYHLELYICRFKVHGPGIIHGGNQEAIMEDIALLIAAIVSIMNNCHSDTKKYEHIWRNPETLSETTAPPPNPPEPGSIDPMTKKSDKTVGAAAGTRSLKPPSSGRVKDRVQNWFRNVGHTSSSPGTDKGTGQDSPLAVHQNGQAGGSKPEHAAYSVARALKADLAPQNKSNQSPKPNEEAQKKKRTLKLIRWADHGKDDFETRVGVLKVKNEELKDILRVAADVENPLRRIRSSESNPTLWKDTEELRAELESLHKALIAVNQPNATLQHGSVSLVVKVEDNLEEFKAMVEMRDDLYHTEPRAFLLFSLLETPADEPSGRFLLTTPVWKTEEHAIANLSDAMANPVHHDQDVELVGVASKGSAMRSHFHLQRLQSAELVGGHKASSLAVDERFKQPERIRLAARIAMAYVHFLTVNQFRPHGPLQKYYLFGQKPLLDTNTRWAPAVVDSVWADFGLGTPPRTQGTGTKGPMSKLLFQKTKIDPAVELGVLIFQVTSGIALSYDTTVNGLQSARESAQSQLKKVESRCGLFMKFVVEACFSKPPGDPGVVQRKIVEQVADSLTFYTSQFLSTEEPSQE